MRFLAAVLLIVTASPAFAAADAAENCGVYTDSARTPGQVTAELKGETLIVRASAEDAYHFDLEAPAAGETFRWAVADTDTVGRAKFSREGRNVVLDIDTANGGDEAMRDPAPEDFERIVYVPFCPGA